MEASVISLLASYSVIYPPYSDFCWYSFPDCAVLLKVLNYADWEVKAIPSWFASWLPRQHFKGFSWRYVLNSYGKSTYVCEGVLYVFW